MQSDNYLIPDVHISYVDATEHRRSRINMRPASPPKLVRLSVTATTTVTITVTVTFTVVVAVDVTVTDIGIRIGIGITLSGVNGRAVSRRMDTHSPVIPEPHPHPKENENEYERGHEREHEHRFITSSEAPLDHTENVHVHVHTHTHTHTLIHTPVSDPHSRVPSVQYTTGRVGVDA